ncbi:metallophosphoesterase [Alistipes putredinis]|uniref:metallophosphoesterase n=1 Tax=Alistipes putredinis TaxID=28117 RepID=UPI0039917766
MIEKQGSKKEPFTFVQIADPQLGFCDKGQDWRWTVDNLKVTVARVNELKPAFVIVTGDLIHNHKSAEQARAYRENIALIDASIPVFHIPGNHDIPKYGAEALAQYLDEFGYDRFSFSYNGSAFIGLNSNAMVCDSERAAGRCPRPVGVVREAVGALPQVQSHLRLHASPARSESRQPGHAQIGLRRTFPHGVRRADEEIRRACGLRRPHPYHGADRGGRYSDDYRVERRSYPLYGASTGINVVDVTPTGFSSEFVANDPADGNIRLH